MEADYGMTEAAIREHNRYRGDEHLFVQFFRHPIQDKKKSMEAGRPIYEDKEMIRIMVPGDKDNIIVREVRQDDKQRFVKLYDAFRSKKELEQSGTPLKRAPFLNDAQIEELKYFGVHTLEQLVNLSDVNAQKFMGIENLKRQAQLYLDSADDEAAVTTLQEQLSERDAQIAALTARLDALEAEETDDDD